MLTKNKIVRLIGILLIVIFPLSSGVFSSDNVVHAQTNVSNSVQVYFNDFDGDPVVASGVTATLGGITNTESVQGYDGYGFGGDFLRNDTGGYDDGGIGTPGSPTTLTLTGLPPHTSIDINFLLAIIDSWDGSEPGEGPDACTDCHPDILTVIVDNTPIFSEAFGYNGPVFEPPPDVLLEEGEQLGFNYDPYFYDAAYDMGLNPAFDGIPHSASTLTIEWFANGGGWQGGLDESWAIDNLEIIIDEGIEVDIDIKPGEDPNPINLKSMGIVPVAVLTTYDFDSSTVDPVSVLFADAVPLRWSLEDVDFDGDIDLLFFFKTQELNLDENSTNATLTGMTFEDVSIVGRDAIMIVGLSGLGTPEWTQVNADGFNDPQNQQIPSLAVFGEYLYAGTWHAVWENDNVISATAQIWRTSDGANWELVSETEANGAVALIAYKGYLYSGSWSNEDWGWGGKVWRSNDGLNWEFVTEDGFGNVNGVARFAVFKNTLYASTWSSGATDIWQTTNGTEWDAFIEPGLGNTSNGGASASEVFNGYLYWGVWNSDTGAQVWRTDGVSTEAPVIDGFETTENKSISALASFQGSLYAGTWNLQGVQVWRSSNGVEWEQLSGVGNPSIGPHNALEVYDGQLYLVVQNDSTGLEVWRTPNGIDWEQVGFAGFGDGNNQYSFYDNATTVFKGNLYVATNNFATGGEVWKLCPTGCE